MTGSNEYTVYKIEDEASTSHQNNYVTTLITLNVGGILYTTTKRTLLKKKKFFSEPFNDFDHNGNIFIDRNGELFKYVLEFMRTDDLPKRTLRDKLLLEELLLEAKFYHIQELAVQINRIIHDVGYQSYY